MLILLIGSIGIAWSLRQISKPGGMTMAALAVALLLWHYLSTIFVIVLVVAVVAAVPLLVFGWWVGTEDFARRIHREEEPRGKSVRPILQRPIDRLARLATARPAPRHRAP